MILDISLYSRHVYIYCESAKQTDKGCEFEIKPYAPSNQNLQGIARDLKSSIDNGNGIVPPWMKYLQEGLNNLANSEQDFKAPSADTDKLYMSIGEKDLIEVAHPIPADNSQKRFTFWYNQIKSKH